MYLKNTEKKGLIASFQEWIPSSNLLVRGLECANYNARTLKCQ